MWDLWGATGKWGDSGWETDLQPEERERLQQMSTNRCERLAVETSQGERNKIAADEHQPEWKVETPEERETRLEFYSTRYTEQPVQSQLPLFQQCLMFKPRCKIFYSNMGTFDTPTCSTCPERFPDLRCQPKYNDRLSCNHDKYAPKLYSSANNCRPVS